MLAKDNMPFSTVEKEGFSSLMKTLAPLYKIPCRKTITKRLEEKYEVLSELIKNQLSTKYVSLTTDIWTEPLNTVSYLDLTVHFLMEDDHKSVTIGDTELSKRHTAEYLKNWLLELTSKWNIQPENIAVIVSDNAANIKKSHYRWIY